MDVVAFKQGIFSCYDDNLYGAEFLARLQIADNIFTSPASISKPPISIAWDDIDIKMASQIINIKNIDFAHQVEVFINVSNDLLINKAKFKHWKNLITSINYFNNIRCVIEVTEDVHNTVLKESISELKDTGSKIALDDFGSKYSTIDRLTTFEWDYCKFDANQINQEQTALAINLCNSKQIITIAEQIETITLLNNTKKHNIDLYQGYYLDKPSKSCLSC